MIALRAWIAKNRTLMMLVGVGIVVALAYGAWLSAVAIGQARERAKAVKAVASSIARNSAALEIAAEQRARDVARTNALEQELRQADDQTVDVRPSDARLARLCRVRAQSGVSELPVACRPYVTARAYSSR